MNLFPSYPDQHGGSVEVAQHNLDYKNWATNTRNFEESNGIELASTLYSLAVTGDTQRHAGEHIKTSPWRYVYHFQVLIGEL